MESRAGFFFVAQLSQGEQLFFEFTKLAPPNPVVWDDLVIMGL